jgi:Right handed beta helix region
LRIIRLVVVTALVAGSAGAVALTGTASLHATEDAAAAPGVPDPGTVGFLGDPGALRRIDESSELPHGTGWSNGTLVVDRANLRLERVHVRGGILFQGRGRLTIRNSIVEGGYGGNDVVVASMKGATIDVRNSTLRWRADREPPLEAGAAIQIRNIVKIIAVANDISHTTDGIQAAGRTRIERNWIHDLALVGRSPNNTHNDGIQVYAGRDVRIERNRIEIGFDGEHHNAAVFFQPGTDDEIEAPHVVDNVLEGGNVTLRFEQPTTTDAVVLRNTFLRSSPEQAPAYAVSGATIARWQGNIDHEGAAVPEPEEQA